MAGNPQNAALWTDADVYIADNINAKIPADETEPFGDEWELVGLLDGEDGFTTTREYGEDESHFAWGSILVRKSRGQFELTKGFSALEDNPATRKLIWPGSKPGKIIVPKPSPIKMAFETREGDKVHRLITSLYAEVDLDGDVVENENELTKYELIATIFPTGDGELFIEQPKNHWDGEDDSDDGNDGGNDGGSGRMTSGYQSNY